MQWFKHDTDANQDARLQNVLLDYGIEGYGLYWYCVELIAGNISEDNLTFQLEHDARIIARNTGATAQKVEEMMRYFVKLGLFEDDNGAITCMKLRNRLNKSMTSNPVIRRMITTDKVESTDYEGFLYFIHAKNGDVERIKIGRSKNPHARLSELRKRKDCIGFNLSIIHTIKCDDCVSLETDYHRKFKSSNIKDEWFNMSDEIVDFLNDVLHVDYELTTNTQNRIDKIRLDQIREEKEDNAALVLQGFNNFWLTWSNCKKDMDVKNTSSKSVTLEKFKKIFNKSYFENNPEQGFKSEIESMCKFAEYCHSDKDNFNPYKNMQTGKFLTCKGWRD